MILMIEKIGQGPTRRCDARCYNAKGGKCDCICQGRNHSAGEKKALENVREYFLGDTEDGPKVTRRAERAIRRMEEANGNHAA